MAVPSPPFCAVSESRLPLVKETLALSLPTRGHSSAQDVACLHFGAYGWGLRGAEVMLELRGAAWGPEWGAGLRPSQNRLAHSGRRARARRWCRYFDTGEVL